MNRLFLSISFPGQQLIWLEGHFGWGSGRLGLQLPFSQRSSCQVLALQCSPLHSIFHLLVGSRGWGLHFAHGPAAANHYTAMLVHADHAPEYSSWSHHYELETQYEICVSFSIHLKIHKHLMLGLCPFSTSSTENKGVLKHSFMQSWAVNAPILWEFLLPW